MAQKKPTPRPKRKAAAKAKPNNKRSSANFRPPRPKMPSAPGLPGQFGGGMMP